MFLSCEKEDEIQTDTISTSIYNKDISNYLNLLKTQSNKENSLKIEALVNAIVLNSVKIYTLKTTEKLLVADLKSLKGFEISDKTKAIFFVYENEITHSNIVSFNVKVPFDNLDKVIVSILDMKKNKDNYTGKISFYNLFQNIYLSNEFESGELTVNGIARIKKTNSITGKSAGCTDWYWITTWSDGSQTIKYLYTICYGGGDCQAYRMSGIQCGGGGGGGDTSANAPAYPSNPIDKALFTYIDHKGRIITERYNTKTKSWEFFSTSLSEVVVNNNYVEYYYLIFQWPKNQQKVVKDNIIYTYDGASGGWEGVPATDELIAEAIEDNIDDSALDPCTKEIMQKLKNTTNPDIAKVLQKFEPSTTYNVTMKMGTVLPGNFAETIKVSKNNYLTTFTQDTYTSTTKLYRATALLHETIHAYMLSVVDDYNTYPTNAPFTDFPELFKIYVSKFTAVTNANAAQHEDMANKYVYAISSALEEYQTSTTGIPTSLADKQVFLDMAWSGLRGTDVYNKKSQEGIINDARIFARIGAEQSGNYHQGQYPAGKPCN